MNVFAIESSRSGYSVRVDALIKHGNYNHKFNPQHGKVK